jgi:AAA+ ATPase superfamily predicted ATPase
MEKLDELNVVKEYLIDQIYGISNESDKQTANAARGEVAGWAINIIKHKMDDRQNFLRHLLEDVLTEIKKLNSHG